MLAASVLFVVAVLERSDVGASQQRSLLIFQIQSTALAEASVDLFLTPQSSRLALTVIELLHGVHAAAAALLRPHLFTLPMTACPPSLT